MIFRYFESLIDPFGSAPAALPPARLAAFYAHHLRQAWRPFAVLLLLGLIVALIEVGLFAYIGRIVDTAQANTPEALFARYRWEWLGMAAVALLVRPLFNSLHDLVLRQAVEPGLTSRIRWQSHRHVLRQSLSFFQAEFAGRIANRVMQTGSAHSSTSLQLIPNVHLNQCTPFGVSRQIFTSWPAGSTPRWTPSGRRLDLPSWVWSLLRLRPPTIAEARRAATRIGPGTPLPDPSMARAR